MSKHGFLMPRLELLDVYGPFNKRFERYRISQWENDFKMAGLDYSHYILINGQYGVPLFYYKEYKDGYYSAEYENWREYDKRLTNKALEELKKYGCRFVNGPSSFPSDYMCLYLENYKEVLSIDNPDDFYERKFHFTILLNTIGCWIEALHNMSVIIPGFFKGIAYNVLSPCEILNFEEHSDCVNWNQYHLYQEYGDLISRELEQGKNYKWIFEKGGNGCGHDIVDMDLFLQLLMREEIPFHFDDSCSKLSVNKPKIGGMEVCGLEIEGIHALKSSIQKFIAAGNSRNSIVLCVKEYVLSNPVYFKFLFDKIGDLEILNMDKFNSIITELVPNKKISRVKRRKPSKDKKASSNQQ